MAHELKTLSETTMQDLLHIEMMQQILEKSKTVASGSPYFLDGKKPLPKPKHVSILSRMLSEQTKTKVRLMPKSEEDLKMCLETIHAQAEKVVKGKSANWPLEVVSAANDAARYPLNIDALIGFAKLYYHSCLDGLIAKA
jgi:hypothetical protein